MTCPTFLFVIFSEMIFTKPQGSPVNLKKPYKSRITCLPLRQQQRPLRSYQPWGCYLRQIIDAERVCKLACKRACEDCSASVTLCVTRCVAPSIKRSAEAQRVRSINPSFRCSRRLGRASERGYFLKSLIIIRLKELLKNKIIFTEHIIFSFPENIISRFDVSVNDWLMSLRKSCY